MVNQVVDAEAKVEEQPNNDNWRKRHADLGNAERLNNKEQDQDTAGYADDCAFAEVWVDDVEALDGAKNRLGGGKNAVRHDEADTETSDQAKSVTRKLGSL